MQTKWSANGASLAKRPRTCTQHFTEEDEEPHVDDGLQEVAAQHVERVEKVEDELGGGSAGRAAGLDSPNIHPSQSSKKSTSTASDRVGLTIRLAERSINLPSESLSLRWLGRGRGRWRCATRLTRPAGLSASTGAKMARRRL